MDVLKNQKECTNYLKKFLEYLDGAEYEVV